MKELTFIHVKATAKKGDGRQHVIQIQTYPVVGFFVGVVDDLVKNRGNKKCNKTPKAFR